MSRRPKGSTRGGQFAPSGRADTLVLDDPLSLPSPQPSRAESKAFFDELAYMAGVGPEIENLVRQRIDDLDAYTKVVRALADILTSKPNEINGEGFRMEQRRAASLKVFRSTANQLFELLDTSLLEGGPKERNARLALRKHGWKVRRIKQSNQFHLQSRGVLPDSSHDRPAPSGTIWAAGEGLSGLKIAPINQRSTPQPDW